MARFEQEFFHYGLISGRVQGIGYIDVLRYYLHTGHNDH